MKTHIHVCSKITAPSCRRFTNVWVHWRRVAPSIVAALLAAAPLVAAEDNALSCAPAMLKDSEKLLIKVGTEPVKAPAEKPRIEVCFVLDTTGSMGGLIEGAKQKIWSMANDIIAAKPTPEVKFSLVAYRDRGDEYVTKVTPLTDDLDAVYAKLREFRADGGGDTPESVSQALDEAVSKIAWSQDRAVLKIIYLVGDAPPHTDYADGPDYKKVVEEAVKRDLIINTVQCGNIPETKPFWTEIAQRGEGKYAALEQTGNMRVVSTPMDKKLSELNAKIGKTLIPYGSVQVRESVSRKQAVAESAAPAAAADRLKYNSVSKKTVQGTGELLDALADGSVEMEKLRKDSLPPELQKLSAEELKTIIDARKAERSELQQEIAQVSKERDAYLDSERKKSAASGKGDAFDEKVGEMLRSAAKKKGIHYE